MLIAIIVLLSLLIIFNLFIGILIVRFWDMFVSTSKNSFELIEQTQTITNTLVKELGIRLPPRPYGVDKSDTMPVLTNGFDEN